MATSINTAEIPVSIVASATAASYTVPSDRYAIVKAQVKGGGTLSIGGVVVLGSDTWSVIANNNGMFRSPGTNIIRNVSATTLSGYFQGILMVGGAVASSAVAGTDTPGLGTNQNIRLDATTMGGLTTVAPVDVFTNSTDRTSDTAQFKVPAGTVIVGAGDSRYLIELYRIPGSAT
jgi:hypothetical protein